MNNNSLNASLDDAATSLDQFAQGPAKAAANAIGDAFAVAGKRVSSALGDAARSGEISVKGLAAAIIRDLSQLAIDRYVSKPVNDLLGAAIKSLPSFGARASGGPIAPGGAYLVGENGPEMFVPNSAGAVFNGAPAQPVTIHINMPQGSSLAEVKRSTNQVAAALARAVQRGSGLL